MRRRLVAAALVAGSLAIAACDNDTGLPDLDAVTAEDLPVDARVELGPSGCEPDRVSIRSGAWVAWTATADDVLLEPAEDDESGLAPDTGLLLDGEPVEWRFRNEDRDALEVLVSCVGPDGASVLTIEVRPPGPET